MGILKRPATNGELRSREAPGEMPEKGEAAERAILPNREDRLAAARGVVIGTILGSIVWAVILWGLKWRISEW